jgi:uncharacterized protein YkwD
MRRLVATLAVAAAVFGLTACVSQRATNSLAFYTNAYRADNGVPQMIRDDPTAFTAQASADRLRNTNGPQGCRSLTHADLVAVNALLPGSSVGENIGCASGCTDASVGLLLTKWKNSLVHRSNWLNPTWTGYGVGLACNSDTAFGVLQFHD